MQFVFYRADELRFKEDVAKRWWAGSGAAGRPAFWLDCWDFDRLFHVEQFGFNDLGDS
jgi:hypothetical protein